MLRRIAALFSYPFRLTSRGLLCAFLLWTPVLSHAAGAVVQIDADAQYRFAERYFSTGEYSRAVDEYKRFIYFFPDDGRLAQAMYQCGMSFYLDRRYADAAASFNEVIEKFTDTPWAVKSYLMVSESQIHLNQFGAAVITLHNLITLSKAVDVRDEAFYRLGWIYIETASWDNARIYFEKISSANREKFRLERLSAELSQRAGIAAKSPVLAGALSIVPGGGFLYCERYQDALIAFLLNGALIWAGYEAFDNDNKALGALLTFVEVGFYAGNIYGAVGSAHKFNRTKTEGFIENLKKNTKIDLSGDPQSSSIRLSLRFAF
ncbi:MAG: tetratricopeptide repeat protein [Thermodesulfobacteriota bacterium]